MNLRSSPNKASDGEPRPVVNFNFKLWVLFYRILTPLLNCRFFRAGAVFWQLVGLLCNTGQLFTVALLSESFLRRSNTAFAPATVPVYTSTELNLF